MNEAPTTTWLALARKVTDIPRLQRWRQERGAPFSDRRTSSRTPTAPPSRAVSRRAELVRRPSLMAIGLLALSVVCAPGEDVLELRDGRLLRGTYVGGTAATLRFTVGSENQVVEITDIAALTIGSRAPAPQNAPAAASAAAPAAAAAASAPAQAQGPAKGTAAAGTTILIRTKDPIDSNRGGEGTRFSGTLEADLAQGGTVLATRGSMVYGELRVAQKSGRLLGKSEMILVLTGIQVDGKIVPCATSAAVVSGEAQGRDTASKVGAGALIGGAADGSDGARKGAAIGGAAALLTRGTSVRVPPGTLLSFTLEQPFTL